MVNQRQWSKLCTTARHEDFHRDSSTSITIRCITFRYQVKVPGLLVSWTALYRPSPNRKSRRRLASDDLVLFVEIATVDDDCIMRGSWAEIPASSDQSVVILAKDLVIDTLQNRDQRLDYLWRSVGRYMCYNTVSVLSFRVPIIEEWGSASIFILLIVFSWTSSVFAVV